MDKTKAKALFALAAGLALTAFAALAFIDNVSVVIRWRAAFISSGGDAVALSAKMPGLLPWFDWAAVDYSCVSTFIPFFGFLLFSAAMVSILAGRRRAAASFPFFASCDQVNISLGLVGTLWGIIMIGYYDMETVSMASLMSCLHTALFSTLVAVVWVYLVAHPVLEPFARGLLSDAGLAEDDEERPIDDILTEIRTAAAGIATALAEQREGLAAFSADLDATGGKLSALADSADARAEGIDQRGRRAAESFSALLESLAKAHDAATGKLQEITAAAGKTVSSSAAKAIEEMQRASSSAAAGAEEAMYAAIDAMEKSRKASDEAIAAAFEKRLEAMDAADAERRRRFAEVLTARLDEFEKSVGEREKAFDEAFGRRLAKLESEASANAERAAKAEGALSRIRDALG